MKIISNKNYFQPRARLLLQLGDKLIRNENIALLELIKNSYDADAKKVKVKLEHIHDKKNGRIDITDDGEGMDLNIIENVWLEPGSDYKAQLFNQNIRSKKYGRLPIGEKGIGRFGVHKLGNKIELVTKKKNSNEVVVRIDWNEFSKHKYLKDAKFEVFERTPEYFVRDRTGTRITITDLRTEWDRKMVRDFYKAIFTLNSPFQKPGNFRVEPEIDDKTLIADLPRWEDIQEFALWHFKCKIDGYSITEFIYEFLPWESMSEVEYKKVTEVDPFIINSSTLVGKDLSNPRNEVVINLSKNFGTEEDPQAIGEVDFEGYIFDRDRTTLELGRQQGISLLKQYLDEQGGIRVYRDNIRINEYGEKGSDWLNLDSRRVNVPAKRVSNNIILAVVDLKASSSKALIEKTNREGFIENEAFHNFTAALLYVLDLVETLRKNDKDDIRNKYNPTEKEEPVLHHLGELKKLVNDKIKDPSLNKQINKHLNKIEADYNQINEILLTSSGVGLTLSVGIHEVEKVIEELNHAIKKEAVPLKIFNLVEHLDRLIENYSDLLRNNESKEEDLIKLLNGALFNVEYRTEVHNIEVDKAYLNFKGDTKVKCNRRFVLGAMMNVLDNSIYWLDRKEKNLSKLGETFKKKIFINLYKERSGNYIILIADNGTGFNLPTHQLTKPFITNKPSGMGLGLHIVKEVMKAQQGEVLFPDGNDYDIPSEYEKGALVGLKIKTN